ncbi:MAG: hypothetical protein A2513_11355 [Sulfurimonas sp. RIFOXYD12_FULL_33_39]|uniref:hypothetical protein n=1 Tax=unclassified Sulfurimonas TaxID=2623549 RepID=UPI0008C9EBF7|nr:MULTISPECIES: hypothetical protein [unclassified Sulfurimonas]OHE01802.1 MAG: hypothetical protein A3G74_03965 [Sulfurimonas sp. RIFCSPLOWO2_12_FULL_34_6]OHE09893.1 MAG: hypothetical protein A2513_11355 [Sulfurimonas sp. RIFOXYD12_FULL_33_39]OHE13599.1 MAG: hypothetical protein A2530_08400 [Sulfurimonas sp. RIFOXYD2_FULL_34_21]DAB28208.1 MAG TPA: hypothetical protein CFH78_03705 [Sulfurimonas sp. UBA10385]
MNNEELFEGIDDTESLAQKYLGVSLTKFLVLIILIFGAGIYIGLLLYGTNSLQVYLGLQDYEGYLQGEIHRLKDENAELQKEYFELKEISAK